MKEIRLFLDDLLDETTNRLSDVDSSIDDLDIKIKENTRFLEVLKRENDDSFSEFSPRNLTSKNAEEIENTENIINEDKEELNNLVKEKEQLKQRTDKIMNMIAEVEEYNSDTKFVEKIVKVEDVDNIKDSLNNIISYLPADPMRAKIELTNLKNNL